MNSKLIFQLKRKFIHIILTCFPIISYLFNASKETALIIGITYFIFWMISEFIRTKLNIYSPTSFLISIASHNKENQGIRFPSWIISECIVIFLFPNYIWLAAATVLAVGDSTAALTGILLKGPKFPLINKTIIGFISGILVSMALIYFFTINLELAILASLFGMIGEIISSYIKINDNFTIPLFASMAGLFI